MKSVRNAVFYRSYSTDGVNGYYPKKVYGTAKYNPLSGKYLPESSGVYTIFDENGHVKYVGSSKDIHKRLHAHGRTGLLVKKDIVEAVIFSKDATQEDIFAYEQLRINELRPLKNKHPGTPGRIWHSENKRKFRSFYELNRGYIASKYHPALDNFLSKKEVSKEERKIMQKFLRIMKYFKN